MHIARFPYRPAINLSELISNDIIHLLKYRWTTVRAVALDVSARIPLVSPKWTPNGETIKQPVPERKPMRLRQLVSRTPTCHCRAHLAPSRNLFPLRRRLRRYRHRPAVFVLRIKVSGSRNALEQSFRVEARNFYLSAPVPVYSVGVFYPSVALPPSL